MRYVLAIVLALLAHSAGAADWPPADTYKNGLGCPEGNDGCEFSYQYWDKQYDLATKGDYQGQRNVSFCLSVGCDGAIIVNKVLACAWRIVIIESGHLKMDDTDTANYNLYCGPQYLDEAGLTAARAQARQIMKLLDQH